MSTDLPDGYLTEILKRENRLFPKEAATKPVTSSQSATGSDRFKEIEVNSALTQEAEEYKSFNISEIEEENFISHSTSAPNHNTGRENVPINEESNNTPDNNLGKKPPTIAGKIVEGIPHSSATSSRPERIEEDLAAHNSDKEENRRTPFLDHNLNDIVPDNYGKNIEADQQNERIIGTEEKRGKIESKKPVEAKDNIIEPEKLRPPIEYGKERKDHSIAKEVKKDNLLVNRLLPKIAEKNKDNLRELEHRIQDKQDIYTSLAKKESERAKEFGKNPVEAKDSIIEPEKLQQTGYKERRDNDQGLTEKKQLSKEDLYQPKISESTLDKKGFRPSLTAMDQQPPNKVDKFNASSSSSKIDPVSKAIDRSNAAMRKEVRLTIGNINIQVIDSASNDSDAHNDTSSINAAASDQATGWNNISNKTYYWKFRYV